jgi:hypothetical protein
VGIARGRSYASILVIPRRKTSLCEALHGRRSWPDLKLHGSSWGARRRGEGEGEGGGEAGGHGLEGVGGTTGRGHRGRAAGALGRQRGCPLFGLCVLLAVHA